MLTRLYILLLFAALFAVSGGVLSAQGVPTAGTAFTFALPEGADIISAMFPDTTAVKLIVVSPHDGSGIVYSPTGYRHEFTYRSNRATEILLPRLDLMQLHDIGKTSKGVIVRTTQPVNLVMHYQLAYAGEATQIFPDEALGTDYLVAGWGLWNDQWEDNHTQVVVTASDDNTDIEIVPTVNCLGGYLAGQTIRATLSRGESYIIKADAAGLPTASSLSRTQVRATKPVSVVSAATCSYVPLAEQACNPLLDHVLPTTSLDSIFYVAPTTGMDHYARIVFTSPTDEFSVISSDGLLYQTNTGRLEVITGRASRYFCTAPSVCHLLTGGFEYARGIGDPSMVTVLPERLWTDTLLWLSPQMSNMFESFMHFVSIVYPSADGDKVLLDGISIDQYPGSRGIPSSPYSAIAIQIPAQVHRIESPVPIFAISNGFLPADAYSAVAMGRRDMIDYSDLSVTTETEVVNPRSCGEFLTTISTQGRIEPSDGIYGLRLTVNYDPTKMTVVSVTPRQMYIPTGAIIDTKTPGVITVTSFNAVQTTGEGELVHIVFQGISPGGQTTVTSKLEFSSLEFAFLPHLETTETTSFDITPVRDTITTRISAIIRTATLGELTMGFFYLEELLSGMFSEIRLRLEYNHDLLEIKRMITSSSLLEGWSVDLVEIDETTDELVFRTESGEPAIVNGRGILSFIEFATFVTDTTMTEMKLSAYFMSADSCPRDVITRDTSGHFTGIDSCGDSELRSFLKQTPLRVISVVPNPINDQFQVTIEHKLPENTKIELLLVSSVGAEVWRGTSFAKAATPSQNLIHRFPPGIASGVYQLIIETQHRRFPWTVVVAR